MYILWLHFILTCGKRGWRELQEVEEEQRCRMFCIYAAGCTNPHIVIVAYSAIRTDSTKTHIVIITNRPIRTDGTQAHVVSIPDSAVFLDSANPHVVIIPDGAIIEDLSNTHIIGIANCSVRLNFAKQHVVVVAERLGITRACNKQERQYSDNKSIHHVAKLQIISELTILKWQKRVFSLWFEG